MIVAPLESSGCTLRRRPLRSFWACPFSWSTQRTAKSFNSLDALAVHGVRRSVRSRQPFTRRGTATQVLVKDGQTIVLGGLRDRQRDGTQTGIPILSGIPIIGGLFGSSDRRKTETKLYLFLTPRILRTDADADSVTAPRLLRGRGRER